MKRVTSLAIDDRVRRAAQEAARRRGMSLSRFVTEILEAHLAEREKRSRFPRTVTFRSGNKFLSLHHDRYAFGD